MPALAAAATETGRREGRIRRRSPARLPGLDDHGSLVQGPPADDILADQPVELRVGERVAAGPAHAVSPVRCVQQDGVVGALGPGPVRPLDDLAAELHGSPADERAGLVRTAVFYDLNPADEGRGFGAGEVRDRGDIKLKAT